LLAQLDHFGQHQGGPPKPVSRLEQMPLHFLQSAFLLREIPVAATVVDEQERQLRGWTSLPVGSICGHWAMPVSVTFVRWRNALRLIVMDGTSRRTELPNRLTM
jgi:hypothetical protein